jgi:hypothetical protein
MACVASLFNFIHNSTLLFYFRANPTLTNVPCAHTPHALFFWSCSKINFLGSCPADLSKVFPCPFCWGILCPGMSQQSFLHRNVVLHDCQVSCHCYYICTAVTLRLSGVVWAHLVTQEPLCNFGFLEHIFCTSNFLQVNITCRSMGVGPELSDGLNITIQS